MIIILKKFGIFSPLRCSLLCKPRRLCLENQKYFLHKSVKRKDSKDSLQLMHYWLLMFPLAGFGLGTWQVQRLHWKTKLTEFLKERTTSDPIPLPENLRKMDKYEYQPVTVKGTFLHNKEVFLGPRTQVANGKFINGIPLSESSVGFMVITPFKLSDREETILVNRGFVPKELKRPYKRQQGQIEGEVELSGLVRLEEKRPLFIHDHIRGIHFSYRNLEKMSKLLDTCKVYLDAVETFPGGPIGSQTMVNPRNEHLQYIITWYSLTVALSYMWCSKFLRKPL